MKRYTARAAAKRLSRSPRVILQALGSGRLKGRRIRVRHGLVEWSIREPDLLAWAEQAKPGRPKLG